MNSTQEFDTEQFKKSVENLKSIKDLDYFLSFYDNDCFFKDPFHEITGKDSLKTLFESMFTKLNNPRFINLKICSNEAIILMTWSFSYQRKEKGDQNFIQGASSIKVNKNGLICRHYDYWDSYELFQAFKILKKPLGLLKRVFSQGQIQ